MRRVLLAVLALLAGLVPCVLARPPALAGPTDEALIEALQTELQRSMGSLGGPDRPAPYFMSYRVADRRRWYLEATHGCLVEDHASRGRYLDVRVRVGTPRLDNAHFGEDRSDGWRPALPLDDDLAACRSHLWWATDQAYRSSLRSWNAVQAQQALRVARTDRAPDFSVEPPRRHLGPLTSVDPDLEAWRPRIREASDLLAVDPSVCSAQAALSVRAVDDYLVNSEGTLLRNGSARCKVVLDLTGRTPDGQLLQRRSVFTARDLRNLPDPAVLQVHALTLSSHMGALTRAPLLRPYTGPALLSGRATAVLFHEVLGHRLEGHRQKDDDEGQTFAHMRHRRILPAFISVVDDPTLEHLGGQALVGSYRFDDEGVPAQRVTLVRDGILESFLTSRSPAAGVDRSNGHGRAESGCLPVARQGNLLVTASRTVPEERLRRMLLEECRRQHKPFGLYIADVEGGYTHTSRWTPQSFAVTPTVVYRVWADGRPDELVRGLSLVGTPLVTFSKILACGPTMEVFSGECGAESGYVPVSGVAPSTLFSQVEIQLQPADPDPAPFLPAPSTQINRKGRD